MFTRNLARNVPRLQQLQQRSLHVSAPLRLQNLYENPETPPLSIKRLDSKGYLLSDGLLIPGGCVFADGRAFLWDVDPPVGDGSKGLNVAWDGWTPERFKVFEKIVPRPEILLFGTGQRGVPPPKAIRDYISNLGIQMDVMDSRNAASTYNLLFEEGRTISAALCPLEPTEPRTGSRR